MLGTFIVANKKATSKPTGVYVKHFVHRQKANNTLGKILYRPRTWIKDNSSMFCVQDGGTETGLVALKADFGRSRLRKELKEARTTGNVKRTLAKRYQFLKISFPFWVRAVEIKHHFVKIKKKEDSKQKLWFPMVCDSL